MPFLIPIVASVGGALLNHALSGPNAQQKKALSSADQLAQEQAQNATAGRNLATQYNGMATPALQNSLNYWQTLLGGDRTAMSSFLGPEITQYAQGQQNAFNSANQFLPRGGARTTTLAEMPFAQARTVGDMFAGVRPLAAGQVGTLGQGIANLGLGALGQSTDAAGSAANNYLNQVALISGLRQQQMNTAAQVGSGLYTWAKGIDWKDWKDIFGQKGRGGGVGNADPGGVGNADPNDPSICWIAAELWGWQDARTQTVRNWILAEHPAWATFYYRTGKAVAAAMRRSRSVRAMAEMLFTELLRKAREA